MTRNFISKSAVLVALVGALALLPTSSEAAFVAWVCDSADCSGASMSVTDEGAGDGLNGIAGAILLNGANFLGYEIVLNTAQSKPAINTGMDLNYVVTNISGGVLGPIWLFAVDTDFSGHTSANGTLAATAPAGTTTRGYICDGDANVGDFSPCSTNQTLGSNIFNVGPHAITADPYALTIGVMIDTLPNGTTATGNFDVQVVPEPASLALFGLGLASLAALRRRQSRKAR